MAGQDVDRGDLAGFVIRDDVHDGEAFSRAPQIAFIQRVMLGSGRHALGRDELFPMRLEGLEKEGVDVHGLTP